MAGYPMQPAGDNPDLVPDEVLVEYETADGYLSAADMVRFGNLKKINRLTYRPIDRFRITDGRSPWDVVPKISAIPGVREAYPNYYRHACIVPNDSLYYMQKPYYDLMDMEDVWDKGTGSQSVLVAVIDTGVDPDHPELVPNLVQGYNVVGEGAEPEDYVKDDSGHGTGVAGVIGAVGNNAQGVAGMTWNVRIMPIRACWGPGLTCTIIDEIEAIDLAVEKGANIINMSIGGFGTITAEEKSVAEAWAAGVSLFAAAGNKGLYLKATGTDADRQNLYYPAALPEVIGVGAVDNNLVRAEFSNYGEVVSEIYAPGVEIVTTIPQYEVYLFEGTGPPYGIIDGTSFSCPMVAAVAVLIKSMYPELGPADIMHRLFSTAVPLGDTDADRNGVDDLYGYGLVDPLRAIEPPISTGSEYFDLGVSGSPIFEDDIHVFVRVKKPIIGAPIVKYSIDAIDEEGEVQMHAVGTANFYMGTFNTDWNGQVRVSVYGYIGGEPLAPISLVYIIKDLGGGL
jgi:subtilisin family serine protease